MGHETFTLEEINTDDLIHDLAELIKLAARRGSNDWLTALNLFKSPQGLFHLAPVFYYALHIVYELRRRNMLPGLIEMGELQKKLYGYAGEEADAYDEYAEPNAQFYSSYLDWLEKNHILTASNQLDSDLAKFHLNKQGNYKSVLEKLYSDNPLKCPYRGIFKNGKLASLPTFESNLKQYKQILTQLKNESYHLIDPKFTVSSFGLFAEKYKNIIQLKKLVENNQIYDVFTEVLNTKKQINENLKKINLQYQFQIQNISKIHAYNNYMIKISKKPRAKSIKSIFAKIYEFPHNDSSCILLNLIEVDERYNQIKVITNKRLDKIIRFILKKSQQYIVDLDNAILKANSIKPLDQNEIDILIEKKDGIQKVASCLSLQQDDIKTKIIGIKESIIKLDEYQDILFAKRANRFFDFFTFNNKNERNNHFPEHSETSGFSSSSMSSVETSGSTDVESILDTNNTNSELLKKKTVEAYIHHKPTSIFDFFRPASKGEKLYENIYQAVNKKLLGKN